MHPVVETKRAEIQALCRELGVLRLDVFGSAVADDFDVCGVIRAPICPTQRRARR